MSLSSADSDTISLESKTDEISSAMAIFTSDVTAIESLITILVSR